LFAECCELDVPFCTQVGHAGPLRESEPGGLSLISIGSHWSFPSFAFSVAISACHGSTRCSHSS
jgi:hypothetical protein